MKRIVAVAWVPEVGFGVAMQVRWAVPDEYDVLGEIMYRAVREGPSPYSDEKRAAWMPAPYKGATWAERLSGQWVTVFESNAELVGFMGCRPDGYLDFAFLLPDFRGQGALAKMFDPIRNKALEVGLASLTTHASLMAQPAFARLGFECVHHETVDRHGETLQRAFMKCLLM